MLLLFGYLVISIGLVFGAPETSMINGYAVTIDNHILKYVENTSSSQDYLGLARMGLVGIASDAFPSDLYELKFLHLHDNNLTELSHFTFQFLMNLENLSLSNNQLTTIDFVAHISISLKKLLLRDNKINYIDPYIFYRLRNLSELTLAHNNISSLENVFYGLTNLTKLDISGNQIESITRNSFIGLTNKLSILNLNRNHIKKLESGNFPDGVPRNHLKLAYNEINEIQRGTFPAELKKLNLTGNSLTTLDPESFNGLSNLRCVDLSSNKINNVKISAYTLFLRYIGQAHVILDDVIWTNDAGKTLTLNAQDINALRNQVSSISLSAAESSVC